MRSPIRFAAIILAGVVILSPIAAADPKYDPLAVIPIASSLNVAVDPELGVLAGIEPLADRVQVYPSLMRERSAKDAKRIDIAGPADVVFRVIEQKRGVFVVHSALRQSLVVVDADSLQEIRSIRLPGLIGPLSASSDLRDPHVYALVLSSYGATTILRINIEKDDDTTRISSGDLLVGTAPSVDGSFLWAIASRDAGLGTAEKAGLPIRKIVHPDFQLGNPIVVAPDGETVAVGNRIFDSDGQLRRELDAPCRAFLSRKPFAVCLSGNKLTVYSTNTWKVVSTLDLPAIERQREQPDDAPIAPAGPPQGFRRIPQSPPQMRPSTHVIEPAGGKELLVVRPGGATFVPLEMLRLPNEPFLVLKVSGATRLKAREKLAIRVQPKGEGVQVSLLKGPSGSMLRDGELVWAPNDGDIGTHEFRLYVQGEELGTERTLSVTVEPIVVKIGRPIAGLEVSNDGSAAVIRSDGEPMLSVLDPLANKVTAQVACDIAIDPLGIDKHFVYVGAAAADAVQIRRRTDLSIVRTIFTPGRVEGIIPVADRLVFFRMDRGRSIVLTVPDLLPAEPEQVGIGTHLSEAGEVMSPPRRVRAGWFFHGLVYDSNFAKVIHTAYVPEVTRLGSIEGRTASDDWLNPWSMRLFQGSLYQGSRRVGVSEPLNSLTVRSFISPVQPMAIVVGIGGDPARRELRAEVGFHDLQLGRRRKRIEFTRKHEEPPTNRQGNAFHRGQALQAGAETVRAVQAGSRLLVALGDEVLNLAIPELSADDFPIPLHFDAAMPPTIATADEPIRLPKPIGAEEPLRWKIEPPIPGVSIDREGLLTVDPSRFRAVEREKSAVGKIVFRALFGREPKGTPYWLPIRVAVMDRSFQRAEMQTGVFLELP